MTDEVEVVDVESSVVDSTEGVEPREPMPPVESRFMFVDISALRAKQLRRGALPRVNTSPDGDVKGVETSKKLEQIAMREVGEGLIVYEIPDVDAHVSGEDMKEPA